ncbi:MAG: PQQ-binding-like beta-propeller repeat protein, partial [Planctomycetaceae bacterium]
MRLLILLFLVSSSLPAQENWSRFRGDNGSGISHQAGIPSAWGESDIAWKVQLDHVGHSSPVIWEKTLLITTATQGGGERFLHSFNADSGQENWKVTVSMSDSPKHQKNSWASSTPVTDGRVICMMMADDSSQRVGAWDFTGRELWVRDLGGFESQHGLGVSPVLHHGVLLVANDQLGPSSLEAMDSMTGETIWTS